MAGEPMKPATNVFAGRSNSSRGVAHCCSRASAQHRDAVAQRHRLGLVVRDVDRRGAEPRLERRDVGPHLHAQLRVEVGERLVHEEHARLAHDRAPHRHALALAAGELTGLALQVRRQLEHLGDLAHPLVALAALDLGHAQREADVVGHAQVRVERVVLEHHRDVAALGRVVADVAVADVDGAGVDLLEPGEHPQRRRLARARRADEHHQLAVADLQVERVQRRRVSAGVDPRRLLEPHLSHRSASRSGPWPARRARGAPAPAPRRRPPARPAPAAPRRRSAAPRWHGR